MKRSIKQQMMAGFAGLAMVMIVTFLVINGGFLERYYISNKQKTFVEIYKMLEEENENLLQNNSDSMLEKLAEKNNLYILVIDKEYNAIYSNTRNMDLMVYRLQGYLFDKHNQKIIEDNGRYCISRTTDPMNHNEYLDMWGELKNGNLFMLQSPIESIRGAIHLFNRFIGFVGAGLLIGSLLFAWYFSKRLSEPIMELAHLSQKMADLDFEAKYTRGGNDEIAILGDSFNQMSEKLKETISDLKNANYELKKDIEKKEKIELMRSEFLGNVSHELKTPIALIQGYAEGLKEGIGSDPESRDFYCDVIMDEANKMNTMVKNLLTLNQLEFGEEEVVFERFDLTELIRGILQSLEIMIEQKEAMIQWNDQQKVYVWGDEFKVEQVLRNYLSNALNHLDAEHLIEIKVTPMEEKVRISVFNSGQPIPEEDVDKIWDKFYKVDKARTREYGGNGIGLSIVKAIMESFNQAYGVSNYKNGVAFWFELDRK